MRRVNSSLQRGNSPLAGKDLVYSNKHIYGLGEYIVGQLDIVEQIWGGDISEAQVSAVTPLEGLLASVVNVPVVTLTSRLEGSRPYALLESSEVLPGVSLGDILSEELSLEVPFGALILVQPKDFSDVKDYSGQKLGEMLGMIILDMAKDASSSVELNVAEVTSDKEGVDLSGSLSAISESQALAASRLQ